MQAENPHSLGSARYSWHMYRARYYNPDDRSQQYVSERQFQTPEAAALYAHVVLTEPDVYADEDAVSEFFATLEQAEEQFTFVVEPAPA